MSKDQLLHVSLSEQAQIANCPACGSAFSSRVFAFRGEIPIEQCNACELQFCSRKYSDAELARFYSSEYFHGNFGYQDYASIEPLKKKTFSSRLRELRRWATPGGRALDVGCANGLLVRTALTEGFDAYGIDISSDVIEQAKASLKDRSVERFVTGVLENCPFGPESFDTMILSDMIEHVHDPRSALSAAHKILKSKGILFIETPNTAGLMCRLMGHHWPLYRPPEHLVYFSPSNLERLLQDIGFQVLEKRMSLKAVNLKYLFEKLSVTNPRMSAIGRFLFAPFLTAPIWFPVGSFWCIARKAS